MVNLPFTLITLGFLPSFSLLKDRSTFENPLVEVNFADGSSDFLILSKYEGLDGHFIGHLENEPMACVAMVYHPEHSELTIMSDRTVGSTQIKWKNNGDVELIPEVFSNNAEMDVARKVGTNDKNDVRYIAKYIKKQDEIENKITSEQMASVPTKNKLQLQVKLQSGINFKKQNLKTIINVV